MMEPLLRLAKLTKTFGTMTVTDHLDLSVARKGIHAIIGPNGAGKTSLINQISGNLLPDSGTIVFDGTDVTRLPPHRRARLGLSRVFQIASLVPDFTALENVALAVQAGQRSALRPFGRVARDDALNGPARDLLQRVALRPRMNDLARHLSHGEQRQLELAVALATGPALLLLDEPLAGAGPDETARLIAILNRCREDCAILLVEHDMDAVFQLADTITVLAQGRIIASGTPSAIRADAAVRAAYLGDTEETAAVQ